MKQLKEHKGKDKKKDKARESEWGKSRQACFGEDLRPPLTVGARDRHAPKSNV